MTVTPDEFARALHLASPALPIGAFSYSQGLETAVHLRLVKDEQTALTWIAGGFTEIIGLCDAPVMISIYRDCRTGSAPRLEEMNFWYIASRESLELRRETEQMGWSLLHLANTLGWIKPQAPINRVSVVAFPTAFAAAAVALDLSETTALTAFCFGWLESQVAAAMKLVPLGQSTGHRILSKCRTDISAVINLALSITPEEISSFAPQLGILSGRHEGQYTRLFRS